MNARRLVMALVLVGFVSDVPASGDEARDVEQLGQLNEAYVQAFNRHESEAIGKLFAPDGDFLILTGELLQGTAAIVAGHTSLFGNNPQIKLEGKSLKRKFLTPNHVLSHGQWKVSGGPAGLPNEGVWSVVQVRVDGKWRYETIRISIPLKP